MIAKLKICLEEEVVLVSQGRFLRGECLSGMRGLKCTAKGSEVSWVYRHENPCIIRQQPWLWLCERQGVHETPLKLSSPSPGNEQPLPPAISLFAFPLGTGVSLSRQLHV